MGTQTSPAFTGRKKLFMIAALLLTMVTCNAASYANNVILPILLSEMDLMDYYSVYAAVASMGMMTALPLSGSLGAKLGTKTVILFGLVAQFVFRFAMMFTDNFLLFGIFYALMGFCSGLYMTAPYAVMAEVVAPEERPKYFGYVAAAAAAGSLIGPYMTGLFVDYISAELGLICYGVFAIIPIIAFVTLYSGHKNPQNKFDLAGLLLLVIFVLCLVMWLSLGGNLFSFASPIGILLPVIAAISLVFLIRREKNISHPAVPVRVFVKKRFRYTFIIQALVVAYATCIGAYGIVYAQQVMGFGGAVSSTVTMPQTIVQFILGLFIGTFIGKAFKKRFRFFGLLAIFAYLAGLLIFFTLTPNTSLIVIYIATGIGGIGQAITQSCYAAFFQTEMTPEEIPAAQGMYQFAGTGGSSVFIAFCGAAINMGLSLNQVFLVSALFVTVALVLAFIHFRFPKAEIEAEAAAAQKNI